MNPARILVTTIAPLLLTVRAFAVVETWDGNQANGGVGDSSITNGLNWADNTAPVSDLINTDLIFGGTTKLAPNFDTVFSADSLTFDNTAEAFVLGGSTITIGTAGIANSDTQTQTINNNVTLGTTASSFQASSGSLVFNGTLALGTNAMILSGAQATTFAGAITGTGTIHKIDSGTLTLSNTTISADVIIGFGTVNIASAGTTIFDSNGSINIDGGTFSADGNLTLNGGQLTRNSTGTLAIAFGKMITIQGGGDVTITGSFIDAGSPITVTGTGSTFTTTSNLTLRDGGDTQVLAGATLSSGSLIIGKGTDVVVDGGGSSLSGGPSLLGAFGNVSTLAFTNGSTGTFTSVGLARSSVAGTTGILSIQSGASVNAGGLFVGDQQFVNTASVTIAGTGSEFTVTGSGMTTIGAASMSTATLTVENGGTFTTGTGLTTVNATGDLNVNAGGTMIVRGDMVVHSSLDIAGTVIVSGSVPPAPEPGDFAEPGRGVPGELDLGALENSAAASVSAQSVAVPEPGSVALLAFGALSLLARRRRSATVGDSGARG